MMETFYVSGIFGTDASAEDERFVAVVPLQHIPVEMSATATYGRTLGVEQEIVDIIRISFVTVDIFGCVDADGLDDADAGTDIGVDRPAQVTYLTAMQLDDIRIVIDDTGNDVLWRVVDENTHFLKRTLCAGGDAVVCRRPVGQQS